VMKTSYSVVNHLLTYSMFLDNFSLNGERARQFVGQSPKSTWFEHFGTAAFHRHYAPGETLSLSVSPEEGSKVSQVSADLIASNGQTVAKKVKFYDDGSHGDARASDGVWTNNAVYTIRNSDPTGQWKARFTGDNQFSSDIAFIVPTAPVTAKIHPRVFFTAAEIAARRAGPEPEPAKKMIENIINRYKPSTEKIEELETPSLEAPESMTGGPYATSGGRNFYGTQNTLARIVTAEAQQYALTGNKDAAQRGKAALMKLCSLPTWNSPWMEANGAHTYYPMAPAAKAAGLGYDMLYPVMTESERAMARTGIMNNAVKPFYRDMVELNRMPSSMSNHIGVILGGIGISLVAIAGDDPA
jgi:hypothetical protein